jgi:hypothetical protein
VDSGRLDLDRLWSIRLGEHSAPPNLFAVAEIESGYEHAALAVLVGGALGENAPVGDGDGGHAAAQALDAPGQRRAVGGPFLQQACLGRDAVAIRAAPLRPVFAGCQDGGGQSKVKAEGKSVFVRDRLGMIHAAKDAEVVVIAKRAHAQTVAEDSAECNGP